MKHVSTDLLNIQEPELPVHYKFYVRLRIHNLSRLLVLQKTIIPKSRLTRRGYN